MVINYKTQIRKIIKMDLEWIKNKVRNSSTVKDILMLNILALLALIFMQNRNLYQH